MTVNAAPLSPHRQTLIGPAGLILALFLSLGLSAIPAGPCVAAEHPDTLKIGVLAPLSGPIRRRGDVVRAGRDPRRRAGQRGRGGLRTTGDDRRRRHAGAGGRGQGGGAPADFPGEGLRARGRVPVRGDRGSDGGRRRATDRAPRPRGRHRRDHRQGAAGVQAVPVRLPGGLLPSPMGGDDRRIPVGPEGPAGTRSSAPGSAGTWSWGRRSSGSSPRGGSRRSTPPSTARGTRRSTPSRSPRRPPLPTS